MGKHLESVFSPRDRALQRVNRTIMTEEPLTHKLVEGVTLAKLGVTMFEEDVVLKIVNEKDNSFVLAEKYPGGVRFYCENLTAEVEPKVTKIKKVG